MFHVGQKVVCVDASNSPGCTWGPRERPVEDAIYTVSEVGISEIGNPAIKLMELPRDQKEWTWFRSNRFRPVVERKTDISVFTKILNDVKKRKRAHERV